MRKLLERVFNRKSSIVIRQSAHPAAAIAIAFFIGISLSLICRAYAFSGFVAADVSLICAAFLALRKNRLLASLTVALAAVAASGLLIALAHRDGFSESDLRELLPRRLFPLNESVSFEGCVVDENTRAGEESIATIDLHAFLRKDQWIACKGKGILKIAEPDREASGVPAANLNRGDRIRGWAIWHVPRNYENPGSADKVTQLARRGIYILGRAKSPRLVEKIPGDCSDPWTHLATSISARVRTGLEPIRENEKGQPAAILASLTIGDYSGLDNATREIFQNSGTYHVLVISGLHVAWIAGVLLQFFKLVLVPERIRYLLAASVILLYTCVVGFQASITRCLWMFMLYLVSRMIFRKAAPMNILLTSAIILLVAEPYWLFETGFQLSFLSVLAIAMTAAPAINKYLRPALEPLMNSGDSGRLFLEPGRWHRYGRNLRTRCEILVEEMTDSRPKCVSNILLRICRYIGSAGLAIGSMVVTSVSVQIWLEPLLAGTFNRMSWISPIANLIVVPFSSIVLAAGIAASIASGLPYIGPSCLWFAGSCASLLLHVTARFTTVSGAWQRCPTPSPAWILAGITLLFLWSLFGWRRFWIPCFYVAALLACLSYGSVPVLGALFEKWRQATGSQREQVWDGNASVLSVTFLDVGQGDSIVIRFPDGRIWVMDAGGLRLAPSHEENAYAFDVGEAVVSRYLWHAWITKLDRVILSHTDIDHAGGIPSVMKNFRIAGFGCSQTGSDEILTGILAIARERHIALNRLQTGMEERMGPVLVRTLNPPANSRLSSINDNSVVLHFSYRDFSVLLTGDLEKSGEAEVLSQPIDRLQLLKVAHHGSRSGTSNLFLDRMQPRWAVLSVGRNNPFGHPSRETMARLQRHAVRSFLTLDEGAITFETDGNRYAIKSYIRGILERGTLQ